MANNPGISEVVDKDGVIADIEAKRFDGTRTFSLQGDVSGTQTWNGDSSTALTINASIGAKKVTQDKIGDKAVGSGQMDDGSVGFDQIDPNVYTNTVEENNTKLVTSGGVNSAIQNAILNRGRDYGPKTVDEINALSNIPTGSTVHVSALGSGDARVVNDGWKDGQHVSIQVRVGEDLTYYISGNDHGWYSNDGEFKLKQQEYSASGLGALKTIISLSQDENGVITAVASNIQSASTSQAGVVQLNDTTNSTSTTQAATANSVKSAYDLANTANTGLANKLDNTGDGKDVTVSFTEASSMANIGTGEKLSVMFGKIKKWFSDLGTAAFKNVPASGNASSTEVVLGSDTRLSAGASAVQDVTVDGTSVVNSSKVAVIPNASTSAKGAVQLASSIGATVDSENNKAATEKAVRDAINALDVSNITGFGAGKTLATLTETDGKISATFQDISITKSQVSDFSHAHGNIQNGGTLQTNDITIANGDKLVVTDSSDSSKVARASIAFDGSTTTKALTPKGTFEAFAKSGDITTAIQALDVPSVGGDGKYISAISETDGKISATATTMDTTPTANSTKAVTSGGIKTALNDKFDKYGFFGNTDGKWIGAALSVSGETEVKYWKLCSFTTSSNYWSLNFVADVTNAYFDSNVFERKIISIFGKTTGVVGSAFEIREGNNQLYSTRGYGNIIYYETSGNNVTIYIKAKFAANAGQYCRLVSVLSVYSISNLTWYQETTAGTQPENPVKFSLGYKTVKPAGSTSVPVYIGSDGNPTACTDDFVHDGDVTSTFSSTGAAPVNGTAVAAALATSLTDVAYVANQSVGGGNLNKTINGTTTSVLTFMNDSEAVAIWNDAKTAAANAS